MYILRGAEAYGENIFKNRSDIYAYISQRSPGLVGLALSWAGGVQKEFEQSVRKKQTKEKQTE